MNIPSIKHLLLIDPIPFKGGSKMATSTLLQMLGKDIRITLFTQDPDSWKGLDARIHPLWVPSVLMARDTGIAYFIKFLFIAVQVLLRWPTLPKPELMIGASGPGIDLASYFVRLVTHTPILQLIHGPVACSKTIGKCLASADAVHYLPGCRASVRLALDRAGKEHEPMIEPKYATMMNGLAKQDWPSPAKMRLTPCHFPRVFWAASLLKWKGLDTLLEALSQSYGLEADICYIQPKNIDLPTSTVGENDSQIHWYKEPEHLDKIRADSHIFVSTSHHEPFGLSILEAMAAGLCIVIPADGSYWDQTLTHGANCIKYKPGDPNDLARQLEHLRSDPLRIRELGLCAMFIARNYHAESAYQPQVKAISSILSGKSPSRVAPSRGAWLS